MDSHFDNPQYLHHFRVESDHVLNNGATSPIGLHFLDGAIHTIDMIGITCRIIGCVAISDERETSIAAIL